MAEGNLTPKLGGVPETLLWPLHNRASEARRPQTLLRDPKAVQLADAIDYPFAQKFGRPDEYHVLRSLRFDEQIRQYLAAFPDATVVALADGLETQFWRVDNGRLRWLVVDLPETVEVRRRLLPESDRYRCLACSALDFRWIEEVDPSKGVFITAQGILMYFQPEEVRGLIAACAAAFPGGKMMFDVIPRWYSEQTLRGYQLTKDYRTPPMPFGMGANEIPSIKSYHPGIEDVREIPPGRGRSFHFQYKVPLLKMLPVMRNRVSSFVLASFRAAG